MYVKIKFAMLPYSLKNISVLHGLLSVSLHTKECLNLTITNTHIMTRPFCKPPLTMYQRVPQSTPDC